LGVWQHSSSGTFEPRFKGEKCLTNSIEGKTRGRRILGIYFNIKNSKKKGRKIHDIERPESLDPSTKAGRRKINMTGVNLDEGGPTTMKRSLRPGCDRRPSTEKENTSMEREKNSPQWARKRNHRGTRLNQRNLEPKAQNRRRPWSRRLQAQLV